MKKYLFTALALTSIGSAYAQLGTYITGPTSNYGTASYGASSGSNAFTVAATGSYNAYATSAADYFYYNGGHVELAGSGPISFYNAYFQQGSNNTIISNTTGVTITNSLTFANGLTTTVRSATSTGALKFSAGAIYSGALSDNRFVDGYVTKTGTDAFTFPVGSATGDFSNKGVRTLAISAPTVATNSFSAAWLAGDPSATTDPSDGTAHSRYAVGSGISGVMLNGYWDWVPVSGTGAGLTVSVSIPDLGYFASGTNLRLVGWNGSAWVNLSGSTGASSNAVNTLVSGTMVSGITAISVGTITTILPLALTDFAANKQGGSSLLSWKVATEQDISSYTIERSADGRHFNSLATTASLGNTANSRTYSLTDAAPLKGANYYRLKITEKDGKVSYSEIRVLNWGSKFTIAVFPNPVKDKVVVGGVEVGMKVILVNAVGQIISQLIASSNTLNVQMSGLPAGTYTLQVLAKDGSLAGTTKLVKE